VQFVQFLEEGVEDEFLEWVIEEEFVRGLEDVGWVTLKGDKIRRGFADRVCFGPDGVVVIVEFKRTGARKNRRGEKLQDHWRGEFRTLGFRTEKVTGWNETRTLLGELLGEYECGD